MAFLNDISSFPKNRLKKVLTETYHLSGKRYIRKPGESEDTETDLIRIYPDEPGFKENENKWQNAEYSSYWSRANGYVVDILPDYSINRVVDRLFISGEDVVGDRKLLDSQRITHILNLTTNVRNKFENEIIYKQILINDLPSVQIDVYFEEAFQFIDGALSYEKNCVLVHCHAGVSRSASFIIAYLMQKSVCASYEEAYEFVKEKRYIRPNDGFIKQLKGLEKRLKSGN